MPVSAGTADDDATGGLVYEAPRSNQAELSAPPSFTPAVADPADDYAAVASPEPAELPDDGISIFGNIPTVEVPADYEPTVGFRSLGRSLGAERRAVDIEPVLPVAPQPTDAVWNHPITPASQVDGSAVQSEPSTSRMRIGSLRTPAQECDGQHKIRIRDLPPDVRLRFWRLRAAIMIVVGLLFGILAKSWVIGLTLALLAGTVDTLYRSRTAANYQNGGNQAGAHRRTRRQLNRMRRRGYLVLHGRPIPNSREFIDHLVIGPTGVYAIDSEKWDSKLPVRTLNGKRLYLGPVSQKDRLDQAIWEAGQVGEILSGALGAEIAVRPVLAIYGPRPPSDASVIRDVAVVRGPVLTTYLRRRDRLSSGAANLTSEQVRTIYDAAARILPDVAHLETATPGGLRPSSPARGPSHQL